MVFGKGISHGGSAAMNEHMAIFVEALLRATGRVKRHYFQLPVAGLEDPIYRERVYCYELYHQLRIGLPADFPYLLNGEVDKNGQPMFRENIGRFKPDFIVHIPGRMTENLVVMEVKAVTAEAGEFREDLDHLRLFLQRAGYYAAISLIYGDGAQGLMEERARGFETHFQELRDKCALLLWHQHPGQQAQILREIERRAP